MGTGEATFRPGAARARGSAKVGPVVLSGGAVVLVAGVLLGATQPFNAALPVAALAVYGAVAWLVAIHATTLERFGAANTVTLARAVVNSLLAGVLATAGTASPAVIGWTLVAGALLSLLLDGVDGHLARRQGLCTAFGARFDVEMDALLSTVLALAAVVLGKAAPWLLLVPAGYRLFRAAQRRWPDLARPLPASLRRKAVFVLQVTALVLVVAPMTPAALAQTLAAAAVVATAASFALDLAWLRRNRPAASVTASRNRSPRTRRAPRRGS